MEYQSARGLEELAAFVAVVDANGFSAAARRAGVRKATLSQRLRDLEGRLGVSLLVRTTRCLRLTEEGYAYLEHAKRCMASAREADAVVTRAKATPSGTLKVTLPSFLAASLFDEVFAVYGQKYPNVSVELHTTSALVDLGREDFDLALRVGALQTSSLMSLRLGNIEAGYFAAPAYLQKYGTPAHVDEISGHVAVSTNRGETQQSWPFWVGEREKRVIMRSRVLVGDCDMAVRAARAGLGIVHAPRVLVRDAMSTGALVPVLAEFTPPPVPLHAVFTAGASSVPRVTVFLELLRGWFHARGRTM